MNRRIPKLILVFFAYMGLLIIDGCDTLDDGTCTCPTVDFPFTDYKGLALRPISDRIEPIADFEVELRPDQVDFIARRQKFSLGLINRVYACSCIGNGSRGDKFAIQKIEVFADKSFKDDFTIDEDLGAFFQVEGLDNFGNVTERKVTDLATEGVRFREFQELRISTAEKPDQTGLDHPYNFRIRVIKENNEVVEAELKDIIFL